MKRLAIALITISLMASCEINKPNGPKIFEESLKHELCELSDFTVGMIVHWVEYIINDGEPFSYSYVEMNKISDDRWEYFDGWQTGTPDFPKSHKTKYPVVLQKQADDSWIASYHGDGMNISDYKDFTFTTKLKQVGNTWKVNVEGFVLDKDDYRMDIGSDSVFVITEKSDSTWKDGLDGVRGEFYLYITKGNTYLHSIKAILRETDEYSWYRGFDNPYTTWIYRELSKPEWLVSP